MSEGPYLSRIFIYPFKGLDPQEVDSVKVLKSGSLEHDREFALFDEDGNVISGKREKKVHKVRSFVDFNEELIRLRYEREEYEFSFADFKGIEEFFSEVFGYRVTLRRFEGEGFPDDRKAHGPTLVSGETLREIAGWFGLDEENVRRRFRTNLEIANVPPFWEDMLVGKKFRVGDVILEGAGISKRCPVPTRDPLTGEEYEGFVKRFIDMRKRTLPAWSPKDIFSDTFYRLCLNTVSFESNEGKILKVGDKVEIT